MFDDSQLEIVFDSDEEGQELKVIYFRPNQRVSSSPPTFSGGAAAEDVDESARAVALPVAVAARKMGALFDTLLRAELAARFMIRARLLVVARYLVEFTVLRLRPRQRGRCSCVTMCVRCLWTAWSDAATIDLE